MVRPLFLILFVMVLGAVGVWLLDSAGAGSVNPAAPLSEPGSDAASDAGATPAIATQPFAAAPAREPGEGGAEAVLDFPELHLLGPDGNPLAVAAEVSIYPATNRFGAREGLFAAPMIPKGEPVWTGVANGQGILPWPKELELGLWELVAEAGDLAAQRTIEVGFVADNSKPASPGQGPRIVHLRLRPNRTLTIRVIDSQKRPLEGAICVLFDSAVTPLFDRMAALRMGARGLPTVVTDADGLAQLRLQSTPFDDFGNPANLDVALALTEAPSSRSAIEWEGRHGFTTIDAGRICTTTLTIEGDGEAGQLSWRKAEPDSEPPTEFEDLYPTEQMAKGFVPNWAHAANSLPLRVSCFPRGGRVHFLWTRPGCPPVAGTWLIPDAPEGELRVKVGGKPAQVRARFLTEAGDVFDPAWIEFSHSSELSWRFDGDFLVALVPTHRAGTMEVLPMRASLLRSDDQPSLTTLRWPALSPGDVHELGDFELPTPQVIAHGTVTRPDGRPAPKVEVRVWVWIGHFLSTLRATTDDRGRYVMRAWKEWLPQPAWGSGSEVWTASSRGKEGFAESAAFGFGDQVDLTLSEWGAIAGRIRTRPELTPMLRVYCTTHLSEARAARRAWSNAPALLGEDVGLPLGQDGRLWLDRLAPGKHRVLVLIGGTEVYRSELLTVVSGEVLRPSGLKDLFVGQELEPVSIQVLGVGGLPLKKSFLWFQGPKASTEASGAFDLGSGYGETDHLGRARLLMNPSEDPVLGVDGPGDHRDDGWIYIRQFVRAPEFPLTVQLEAYPRCEIRFASALPDSEEVGWIARLSRPRTPSEMAAAQAESDNWAEGFGEAPVSVSPTQTWTFGGQFGVAGASAKYQTRHTPAGTYALHLIARWKAITEDTDAEPVFMGSLSIPPGKSTRVITVTPQQQVALQRALKRAQSRR